MKHKFLTGKNTKEGIKIMKNKTEQLKELFQKWYSEQEKSDFENSNHFSVDGLIKADDEDCVVLFVLAEPHSTEDHKYNLVFWFRRIWEDYDELCKDSGRNAKAGIKKYKNRIELCATALGVKEIPHGIAVMDTKKCGSGSTLSRKVFVKSINNILYSIRKQNALRFFHGTKPPANRQKFLHTSTDAMFVPNL